MRKPAFSIILLSILFLGGCIPYEEEILTDVRVDYTVPDIQKVYNFKDRSLTDSLLPYFEHPDPTYRYLAARAFSTLQDPTAIPQLSALLSDPVEQVRCAAAHAIGQIGAREGVDPLIRAFDSADTLGQNQATNGQILEAVARCGTKEHLELMSTVTNYRRQDTLLIEGQARAIYRFGLRDITALEGTDRMVVILSEKSMPPVARIYAANYFKRIKGLKLSADQQNQLVQMMRREENASVRMALAEALGQYPTEEVREALVDLLKSDPDYLVRIAVIRALGSFRYDAVKENMFAALQDRNLHVATLASAYFVDHGISEEATLYRDLGRDSLPWPIQLNLLRAANRHLPAWFAQSIERLNNRLTEQFRTAEDPYEKAACLEALGEHPWNFRIIRELGFASDFPPVRVASVRALGNIWNYPAFSSFFGRSAKRARTEIAEAFQAAVMSGDVGMISESAEILAGDPDGVKAVLDSVEFLADMQARLPLPQALEAYMLLGKAISAMGGVSVPEYTPRYNHPVNWALAGVVDNRTRGIIETEKGDIVISFFGEEAPGSVANFIELAENGFFNGKTMHRVVPNFVAQGGCPRGDGYGSLDYTIRSEFSGLYYDRPGRVGMASAGKDTECTQFFVTHSPTPHLDGRYTIFGQVVQGMDVVHKLQVGDKILDVDIRE